MIYYKLVLTLLTGQEFAKLFSDREDASTAFTVVSHCHSLDPFAHWYTDAFLLQAVQRLLDDGLADSIRELIPQDYRLPPLIPYRGDLVLPRAAELEWDNPVESLTLWRCQGSDSLLLERLDREQLLDLADRWDRRTADLEPVPNEELM